MVHLSHATILLCVFFIKKALSACTGGILLVGSINATVQNEILNAHNSYRTMVKDGKIPGQPKAKTMPLLEWDSSLASAAQNIANTCVYGHVSVKDDRFYVGQNIAMTQSNQLKMIWDWKWAMGAWFDEYKIYKYPDFTSNTGHYTQMVWSTTTKLGCGSSIYNKSDGNSLIYHRYYVCNYGPGGNIIGRPPYTSA